MVGSRLTETRDQQHLRILTDGVRDRADWPAADYLIEKGYARGNALRSNQNCDGEIISLIWDRPTAAGQDYIERLRASPNVEHTNIIGQQKADQSTERVPSRGVEFAQESHGNPKDKSNNSPWITIAVGVAILVIFALIVELLRLHLGIDLG